MSAKHASERKETARVSTFAACPICGRRFLKTRPWATFCSPKCRKQSWAIKEPRGSSFDLRSALNRIESKLDQILLGR